MGRLAQAMSGRHPEFDTVDYISMAGGPAKTCQFTGGVEIGPMCGEKSQAGYSYCPAHMKICYRGVSKLNRKPLVMTGLKVLL